MKEIAPLYHLFNYISKDKEAEAMQLDNSFAVNLVYTWSCSHVQHKFWSICKKYLKDFTQNM